MKSTAGCWTQRLVALAIAMSWLTGCAMVGSDPGVAVCPPVVAYSRAVQAQVADEIGRLPDGSAIVEMLSNYAVMREQARACAIGRP